VSSFFFHSCNLFFSEKKRFVALVHHQKQLVYIMAVSGCQAFSFKKEK